LDSLKNAIEVETSEKKNNKSLIHFLGVVVIIILIIYLNK